MHGLDPVHRQIYKRLLQLNAISADRQRPIRPVGVKLNAIPSSFAPNDTDRVHDDVIEVEFVSLDFGLFLQQVPQVGNDIRRSPVFFLNVRKYSFNLFQVWGLRLRYSIAASA